MKNKKGIRVEGYGRKTTTAAPFKQKWPKIKRPNIPRVQQTEDDNNTDSNSTTTVTPDGNIAQQDSVVVTLSIGNIGGSRGAMLGTCHLLWGPILSFLHTFSPKSACVGGPCPPQWVHAPPGWKILENFPGWEILDLPLGKILYMKKIKIKVKNFLFFLFFSLFT